MSWLSWLRVIAVTIVLVPFVQLSTRAWAERAQAGARHLRILESLSLGTDGRLYLVEVAGRVLALAAGPRGMEVITEVSSPELLAELGRGEGLGGEVPALGGAKVLSAWAARLARAAQSVLVAGFGRRTAQAAGPEGGGPPAVLVLQGQLERVRRLGDFLGDEVFAVGKR